MDIKKLLAAAGAGALLLGSAIPAFAWWGDGDGSFTLIKNKAWVKNIVVTKADTGDNYVSGDVVVGGDIDTGDAAAGADVWNMVNSNELGCGCLEDGALIIKNKAGVKNVVITKADTGDNYVSGGTVVGGDIDTGDADAVSLVTNVVNTNVVDGI